MFLKLKTQLTALIYNAHAAPQGAAFCMGEKAVGAGVWGITVAFLKKSSAKNFIQGNCHR